MKIVSSLNPTGEPMDEWSADTIKNEPMLFNCDLHHAFDLGGPITKQFVELLPSEFHSVDLVIDTRVHMLMPSWYPCIPGWHHDDVPRTRSDGQPDYANEERVRSFHCMAIVGTADSVTQFAIGEHELPIVPLGQRCYERYDALVNELITLGVLKAELVKPRMLHLFNDEAWHRGTPCKNTGWRWFGRASRYETAKGIPTSRGNPRTNEIRRQVQVYMDSINAGW